MTPSDLPALARVLDALLPHRTVSQLADDPQAAGDGRPDGRRARAVRPAGAGLRPVGSHAATNGSATGARRAPCPSPFSGQVAATTQRRGGRCQGWRACLLRATRRAWP